MAKKVDHELRKREIAEKAMRLFSQVGYENVSLIMIAASSGVSRTALYQYFCSKREVMDAAILSVTSLIAAKSRVILTGRGSSIEKLEGVCHAVVEEMFRHKEFLVAVFDFVIGQVRTGADMQRGLSSFTAGTCEAIRRLLAFGRLRGEFSANLDEQRTVDVLYSEFESCAMRIVLGTECDSAAAKLRFSDMIKAISAWR